MRVITGLARGRRLETLQGTDLVRPTSDRVKEGMFSSIQFNLSGKTVLDLFSGSGQLGIEAISRGAESAVFVDSSRESLAVTKRNVELCGFSSKSRIINSDSISYLKRCVDRFDYIFIDPPYNSGLCQKALEFCGELLNENGMVFCETDFKEELPETSKGLILYRVYKYSKIKITTYKNFGE